MTNNEAKNLLINDLVKTKLPKALKHDSEKPSMDLLPVGAKKAIAEVFDFGAKKYARHNWRNGFNYSRLIAAAERHLDAFNDGEDLDPESGKPHLAHLGCCVLMLLESTIKGYGVDDRYKPEKAVVTTANPDVPIGKTEICTLGLDMFGNPTDHKHPLHCDANEFKKGSPTIPTNDIKKGSPTIAVDAWRPSENSTSDHRVIAEQMGGLNDCAKKVESWLERKVKEAIK
jgi:hypothetical protein